MSDSDVRAERAAAKQILAAIELPIHEIPFIDNGHRTTYQDIELVVTGLTQLARKLKDSNANKVLIARALAGVNAARVALIAIRLPELDPT